MGRKNCRNSKKILRWVNLEDFITWQDEEKWLGYLRKYPEFMTQGDSLMELKANLEDIYSDIMKGKIFGSVNL